MSKIKWFVIGWTALALCFSPASGVRAFTFDFVGGDSLTWFDDFDDNSSGWNLTGTEVSNMERLGKLDTDTGGVGNCSVSQAGGFESYLHIGEDDGANGFSGASLTFAQAEIDLTTSIDLSGGPVSIYMALWSPSGNSPRQIVEFSAPGNPSDNISFEWLSSFQSQIMVDCALFGACAPTENCGGGTTPCPNGHIILGCNPNQFRLTLDASGNVDLQAYNLLTSDGTWQELQSFNHTGIPQVMEHIRIGLTSDGNGGERVHAIGATEGLLPGYEQPSNAVINFSLYSQ